MYDSSLVISLCMLIKMRLVSVFRVTTGFFALVRKASSACVFMSLETSLINEFGLAIAAL